MKKQQGITLIEMMIALGLGLVVLFAVTVIFANTSGSRGEMEKSNRQTENGRYATQLLANNLRMAGYLAEFDPTPLKIDTLGALPDPCATDVNDLLDALPLHVQGLSDTAATPSCVSDRKSGTGIIVVRRTNSCVAGSANCDAFANGAPHLQASLCAPATGGTELGAPVVTNADYAANYFALSTSAGDLTRHKSDCTTIADIYRYRVDIYFIANNNENGDGIPTLKRAELGSGGFTIVPLVDGIDNMQIDYGIDTNNDGTADVYTSDPGAYGGCAGLDCVTHWRNTMSARVHLLVKNIDSTGGHVDNRTYTLGLNADGTAKTVGPFSDAYKRHVYTTTSRFANPAWRRQ